MMHAMRILLTNDDGIDAPGLAALYEAIKDLGEVSVVAPHQVQSATSHAITFHRPIAVHRRGLGYAVEGRPADCVKLGLSGHLKEARGPFDLVISGMNAGANVGVNVLYSGTVGAAREATFNGIPGVAVSLHLRDRDLPAEQWGRAGRAAREAIDVALSGPINSAALVNINVPVLDDGRQPRGLRITPVSTAPMRVEYEQGADGEGRATYRVMNSMTFSEHESGTDVEALLAGYTTLSPCQFDTTCWASLERWVSRSQESGNRNQEVASRP
jgi:5'-nucleotidase